ncbi:unnamed protein product [Periconia digitata]|uniref:Uncharacterized protein n=1 Tax=Periconia digitata TaxID=1303443 RepID=A0A9W4URR8_9PLEO|nr:unnamed protein product [Periconia digitata]
MNNIPCLYSSVQEIQCWTDPHSSSTSVPLFPSFAITPARSSPPTPTCSNYPTWFTTGSYFHPILAVQSCPVPNRNLSGQAFPHPNAENETEK